MQAVHVKGSKGREIRETLGNVGHGVRGTDPDAAVVPVDALELCDGGEVKYPGELCATEVHLDHEVRSAGDRAEFGSRRAKLDGIGEGGRSDGAQGL